MATQTVPRATGAPVRSSVDAHPATPTNSAEPRKRTALFEPFSWIHPATEAAAREIRSGLPPAYVLDMAARTRDIACGLRTLLELLERDAIDEDCADENGDDLPPLLSPRHQGDITRLAVVALDMLSEEAARVLDVADEAAGLRTCPRVAP